jgi:hypothetical protein
VRWGAPLAFIGAIVACVDPTEGGHYHPTGATSSSSAGGGGSGGGALCGDGKRAPGELCFADAQKIATQAGELGDAAVVHCGSSTAVAVLGKTPMNYVVDVLRGDPKDGLAHAASHPLTSSTVAPVALASGPFGAATTDALFVVPGGPPWAFVALDGDLCGSAMPHFPNADASPTSAARGAVRYRKGKAGAFASGWGDAVATMVDFNGASHADVGQKVDVLAAGDFDTDGNDDFAYASESGALHAGKTNATVTGKPVALATGDFDGDIDIDVLVATASGDVFVYANAAGAFSKATSAHANALSAVVDMALGDLDGDGKLDVAILGTTATGAALEIFRGPKLDFARTATLPVTAPLALVLADLNGDGALDLCASHAGSSGALSLVASKP